MKIKPRGNAPIEVFPFVSMLHCEVVLRHHDGESQDIELAPAEARRLAVGLVDAADRAELIRDSVAKPLQRMGQRRSRKRKSSSEKRVTKRWFRKP